MGKQPCHAAQAYLASAMDALPNSLVDAIKHSVSKCNFRDHALESQVEELKLQVAVLEAQKAQAEARAERAEHEAIMYVSTLRWTAAATEGRRRQQAESPSAIASPAGSPVPAKGEKNNLPSPIPMAHREVPDPAIEGYRELLGEVIAMRERREYDAVLVEQYNDRMSELYLMGMESCVRELGRAAGSQTVGLRALLRIACRVLPAPRRPRRGSGRACVDAASNGLA